MWYSDRTRYMAGHECGWKRLLQFHAFNRGLTRNLMIAPLATGIAIHSALERILHAWKAPPGPSFNYPLIIGPVVEDFSRIVTEHGLENYDTEAAHEQVALAAALPLAYARVCEQWFRDEFDILAIEHEMPLMLDTGLTWQTRSDFITYSRTTATYAVHDFKSSAVWYDDNVNQWRDNLQQMVNGYAAGKFLNIPVTHYYIHILVKGTKRSPSPIVKPWYQPANPPFQIEDFAFDYYVDDGSGKRRRVPANYERTGIWKATEDPAKFVMERVPIETLKKSIIVIGPFGIDNAKVERFLNGLSRYEFGWHDRLQTVRDLWQARGRADNAIVPEFPWNYWHDPAFQRTLDEYFPRTYQCFKYGGQQCEFYNLCHQKLGWDNPLGNGEFTVRTPHHTTEEIE